MHTLFLTLQYMSVNLFVVLIRLHVPDEYIDLLEKKAQKAKDTRKCEK